MGIVTSGLVGYWNSKSGAFQDLSDNKLTGEVASNVTIDATGYKFNSTSSYLDIPVPTSLNTTANIDFSFEFRLKYTNAQATIPDIWSNPEKPEFLSYIYDGQYGAEIYCYSRTSNVAQLAGVIIPDMLPNTEYYVSMTYEAATKNVRFYLNGAYTNGGAAAIQLAFYKGNKLRLGSTSSNSVTGILDNVRMYNKKLTDAEVTQNFQNGTALGIPTIVKSGPVSLPAISNVESSGIVIHSVYAQSTVTSNSEVIADGVIFSKRFGQASMQCSSTVEANPTIRTIIPEYIQATVTSTSQLIADGTIRTIKPVISSITINGNSAVQVNADVIGIIKAQATIIGTSAVQSSGILNKIAKASLNGSSGLGANAVMRRYAKETLSGNSQVIAEAAVQSQITITMSGTSNVSAVGQKIHINDYEVLQVVEDLATGTKTDAEFKDGVLKLLYTQGSGGGTAGQWKADYPHTYSIDDIKGLSLNRWNGNDDVIYLNGEQNTDGDYVWELTLAGAFSRWYQDPYAYHSSYAPRGIAWVNANEYIYYSNYRSSNYHYIVRANMSTNSNVYVKNNTSTFNFSFWDLCYDSGANKIYGVTGETPNPKIVQINPATGAVEQTLFVTDVPAYSVGLAFNEAKQQFIVTEYNTNPYKFHVYTKTGSKLGTFIMSGAQYNSAGYMGIGIDIDQVTGDILVGNPGYGFKGVYRIDGNFGTASAFKSSGNMISAPYDLGAIDSYDSSTITWNSNVPAGTTLTVQVSLDNGTTFTPVTNGGSLPGLTNGQSLVGKKVIFKQLMTTSDTTKTPEIWNVQLSVNGILLPPPQVYIDSVDSYVVSDEPGFDMATISFIFKRDVTEWKVLINGIDQNTGTLLLHDLDGNPKDTRIDLFIRYTDLVSEGDNRINIYGKDNSGVWTPYGG